MPVRQCVSSKAPLTCRRDFRHPVDLARHRQPLAVFEFSLLASEQFADLDGFSRLIRAKSIWRHWPLVSLNRIGGGW